MKHAYTQTDTMYSGRDKAAKKIFNTYCTTSKLSPCSDLAHKENRHDKDYPLFPDVSIIYFIQGGSVSAHFTGTALRVKYFKSINPKEINQDTSTV